MREERLSRKVIIATATLLATACSSSTVSPSDVTAPGSGGSAVSGSPASAGSTAVPPSLSGVVLGVGAMRGRIQYVYGPTMNRHGGTVNVDADRSYAISNIPPGTRVNLLFTPDGGLGAGNLFQICAAYVPDAQNSRLNVELFPEGVMPPDSSPTLSGVISRRDETGNRIPVRTTVIFSGAASMRADSQGRYTLCRLRSGPGILAVDVICSDQWIWIDVEIKGETVKDVDVTDWFNSCPPHALTVF